MNIAAVPVIAAALLAVVILLLRTYLPILIGDVDRDEYLEEAQDLSMEEICFKMVSRFGGLMMIITLGTAVGVLVWNLSLSAVGLYGNPVRELAIGLVVAPVFVVFSYSLKYMILDVEEKSEEPQRNDQNAAEPSMDFLRPETRSELCWLLGGMSIQASAEEVFLRAALVGAPAALLSVSAWYFVVPSAVLFGLMHITGGIRKILHTSILGVVLGAVFVVGGILAAMVVHVLHNQFSAIKDYYKASSTTPSSSGATPEP